MSQNSTSKKSLPKLSWSQTGQLIKNTTVEYFKESSLMHSASLAYFTLFALIPLLYLGINVFGKVMGNDFVRQIIGDLLQHQIGIKDISGIMEFLETVDIEKGSVFLSIIGVGALLFSCSAFLFSLKRSLNEFLDIESAGVARRKLLLNNLLFRLISIVIIAFFGVLIIGFYIGETILMSISSDYLGETAFSGFFTMMIESGGYILMNVIIFWLIFKFVHDGKVHWKLALGGAVVTSILLYIGQVLIKYYLGNFFFASRGGLTGTFFILLAWVYYSAQIIFFGAKFIAVYAQMVGRPIRIKFKTQEQIENSIL